MTSTTRAAILIALVIESTTTCAESSLTSMEVSIEILPIQLLHVDEKWDIAETPTMSDGLSVLRARTEYGVTSTVPGTLISATLLDPLPPGVNARVEMKSTVGQSTGWNILVTGERLVLVSGIVGAEFNVICLEFWPASCVLASDTTLQIAFEID